jgi:hypothetical protein
MTPTLAERIRQALAGVGKPLDDDQLAALLGVRRQAINSECRRLEARGRLVRRVSVGNKIQNLLTDSAPPLPPEPTRPTLAGGPLNEDEVKAAVRDYLQAQGYKVIVAWGRTRGVDIDGSEGS